MEAGARIERLENRHGILRLAKTDGWYVYELGSRPHRPRLEKLQEVKGYENDRRSDKRPKEDRRYGGPVLSSVL